jgi:hypothetical protein
VHCGCLRAKVNTLCSAGSCALTGGLKDCYMYDAMFGRMQKTTQPPCDSSHDCAERSSQEAQSDGTVIYVGHTRHTSTLQRGNLAFLETNATIMATTLKHALVSRRMASRRTRKPIRHGSLVRPPFIHLASAWRARGRTRNSEASNLD